MRPSSRSGLYSEVESQVERPDVKVFDLPVGRFTLDGESLRVYAGAASESDSMPIGGEILPAPEGSERAGVPIGHLPHALLNIANACNMKCKYCFAQGGSYGGAEKLMSATVLRRVIGRLSEFDRVWCLTFFGGEPTLNPRAIRTAVSALEGRVGRYAVITNGYELSDNLFAMLDKNRFLVTVSIDGPKDIHDRVRGGFDRVAKSIRTLTLSDRIDLRLACQVTPVHLERGVTVDRLHEFFRTEFPNIPYFIGPVFSSCSPMRFSKNQRMDLVGIQRWEIEETFQCLKGETPAGGVYSKAVTGVLERLIFRHGSDKFCTKCSSQNTINFDIDGREFPCHVLFGRDARSGDVVDVISDLNEKGGFAQCRTCWAMKICKRCPAADWQLGDPSGRSGPGDDGKCEKRAFIEEVTRRLLMVRANGEEYQRFARNFAHLYRKIHQIQPVWGEG